LWALILNSIPKLRSKEAGFIMEMPPYRTPTARRVLRLTWTNLKAFLIKVGTIIFAVSVIIWVLSNFSFTFAYVGDAGGAGSMLAIISTGLAYVFYPAGGWGWQAVVALMAGFAAKEAVIASLGSMAVDGNIAAFFSSGAAAYSFLVFVLLYVPCLAAVAAIRKESGRKWMWLNVAVLMGTAYVMAVLAYWLGMFFTTQSAGVILGVVIPVVIFAAAAIILWRKFRKKEKHSNCSGCGKCE
jgi:ferrous iron transport protein B